MTSQDNRKQTGRLHSCACVTVANCSDEALTIPKATVLGIVEGISECLVDKINARSETNLIEPAKPPRKRRNETLHNKHLHGKLDQLSPEEREHIVAILVKYSHVLHDEESKTLREPQSLNITYP
jgi:hypothetical protein